MKSFQEWINEHNDESTINDTESEKNFPIDLDIYKRILLKLRPGESKTILGSIICTRNNPPMNDPRFNSATTFTLNDSEPLSVEEAARQLTQAKHSLYYNR